MTLAYFDSVQLDKLYVEGCAKGDHTLVGLVKQIRNLQAQKDHLHQILSKDYNTIVCEVAKIVSESFQIPERLGTWVKEDHRAVVREELYDAIEDQMVELCLTCADDLHAISSIMARTLELRPDIHAIWKKDGCQ